MITLHRSKNKQFYFRVMARNGRILATSETYTRKRNAVAGIKALRKSMKDKFLFVDQTKKVK